MAFVRGEQVHEALKLLVNCPVKALYFITAPDSGLFQKVVPYKQDLTVAKAYPVPDKGFLTIGKELTAQFIRQGKAPVFRLSHLGHTMLIAPWPLVEKVDSSEALRFTADLFINPRPQPSLVASISPTDLIVLEGEYKGPENTIPMLTIVRPVRITLSEKTKTLTVD